MRTRGKVLTGGVVGLLVIGAIAFAVVRSAEAPKPSLPFPTGQVLTHVSGNCKSGNELFGCNSESGPRSFLRISVPGAVAGANDITAIRKATDTFFTTLGNHGWKEDAAGRQARDFSEGGQPEDIQPVYCEADQGCVGLFRFDETGFVLAWWNTTGSFSAGSA